MNTTADKLELLLRTKERQKAYLQEKYPLLDFDTIPFRAYLDLFQGRSYVPGFVGGWKAYGRSNDEDADTRKYLYDYSGNGRDIKLYNFAFSGMSGYGGYPQSRYDFRLNVDENADILEKGFKAQCYEVKYQSKVDNLAEYALSLYNGRAQPWEVDKPQKIKAGYKGLKVIWANDRSLIAEVNEGEIATFTITQSDIDAGHTLFYFGTKEGLNVGETTTIQFLADYPGALVSDGVDDYGQCIKDFALPDDYTVVAVRKRIFQSSGILILKGNMSSGIGVEVDGGLAAYSYGKYSSVSDAPALFSYQTKSSYNGQVIDVGTGIDTTEDKLRLFNEIPSSNYVSYALYDVRIYDHTLTAEELQTVKDEMMSDYENATGGGITDITYVADWDGKGRSNDEEEPMRSQWIDKATGKVINLSNYSFNGMSGWNGSEYDFYPINDSAVVTDNRIVISKASSASNVYSDNPPIVNHVISVKVKVSGLAKLVQKGEVHSVYLIAGNLNGSVKFGNRTSKDGIADLSVDISDVEEQVTRAFLFVNLKESPGATLKPLSSPITIEVLPDYPGALVSDGVDDRGISAEVINEEIKTVVMHLVGLAPVWAFFIEGADGDQTKRIGATYSNGKLSVPGIGNIENDGRPYGFNRNVPVPNNKLNIGCAEWLTNPTEYGKSAIRRLIFIKEQLDAAQMEFLTWKVGKEYRDWCKKNGYEYAMEEMLNN